MSYNGSGTFQINTSGQPVVAGTVISSTAFNALTADLATGLSTAITKDGQTTTTARIPFAAGINSSLTTDSSSVSTGSIITAGGVGIAKALYVGTTANVASTTDSSSISTGSVVTAGGLGVAKNLYVGANANVAGTLGVTGVATFSAAPIYSSLTASSAVATDASKALVSVANTGTGNNVLATAPTIASANLTTALTLTGAAGTTGQALTSQGTGVAPIWSTVSSDTVGFKNRIINGAMVISQRNAGAAVTVNDNPAVGLYPTDRFLVQGTTSAGVYTAQQSTSTPPAGFTNFLRMTTTTASASPAAGAVYVMSQIIEGYNIADFGFGAAGASTITVSFWVRSSLTGTFSGSLRNGTSFNRSYPFTYAISAANTWEQKTVTIAGDTSGTWSTGNTGGLVLAWDIGGGSSSLSTANSWQAGNFSGVTGSTRLISTLSATLDITGVQVEKGSTATSFDYRPFGTELQLAQRYFEKSSDDTSASLSGQYSFGNGGVTTGAILAPVWFSVPKRTAPTVTIYDGNSGTINQITRSTPGVGSQGGQTASTQGINTRVAQVFSNSGNSHSGIAFYWTASSEL